jgi:hypothetical protein
MQGRSVHVNRVSPANILKNQKIKSFLSYFRGSVVLHTLQHSRTDKINASSASYSQLVDAYVRREPNDANNAWSVGAG